MATDTRRLGIGAALLALGSIVVIFGGFPSAPIPGLVLGVAALAMAAGSLLIGFSQEGMGV
ncbi:hypothetical protein [Halomarina ordinaria]|uniref:Transporter n=1 Tax=Halomarina ordinaria TaxID=3033939 RepID=A0ABD5UCY9_9EURY|nr:hypothetical protein [Halomarina sp. PSRA2]